MASKDPFGRVSGGVLSHKGLAIPYPFWKGLAGKRTDFNTASKYNPGSVWECCWDGYKGEECSQKAMKDLAFSNRKMYRFHI
jgi:hypothetical protein